MSEGEKNEQANSALTELQNILSQAQTIASELNTRHQSITEKLTSLEGQRSAAQQVIDALEVIRTDAAAKKNSVDSDVLAVTQKTQEFNTLKERLDNIANELQNRQSSIDEKIAEIESSLGQLRSDMANLKQTIDAELPSFRQRVESEQTSLRQGIEAEQTALRQKLEELSTSFQTKHTEQQELRSKEFSDKINELQQQTNQRIAEEIKAAERIMAALEKYEDQAKQVLGTVISTSQAGVYKSDAIEEGKSKKFFRAWASTFMILAVIILIGPYIHDVIMQGLPNSTIKWEEWLARLPVSVVLFLPAFYFARESTRHSNNERKSKRREQILSTIDPYLELLDPKIREGLKAKLAEKIFDPTDGDTTSSDDDVKGIFPHITGLIAAIKGGK